MRNHAVSAGSSCGGGVLPFGPGVVDQVAGDQPEEHGPQQGHVGGPAAEGEEFEA